MKKVISIIGARPQFIKHAPLQVELEKYFNAMTIHTGQHYDKNMSDIFFKQLNIAKPSFLLKNTQSSNQGEQTAKMLTAIEKILITERPDFLIVYGDTNSTLAGTLAAIKLHIPIVHIEAGLRSYNRTMPEEINRIIADSFSTLLFCPTKNAKKNLHLEGIKHKHVFICGDVMIDAVEMVKATLKKPVDHPYYFATLHRPYNTDEITRLKKIIKVLDGLPQRVIFPIHPRTRQRLLTVNFPFEKYKNILFTDPVSYNDCLSYQYYSTAVITDSGGIQKEAYHLRKKCITIRSETEWTETLKNNWNMLVYDDLDEIKNALQVKPGQHNKTLYGNGKSSIEIVKKINNYFNKN